MRDGELSLVPLERDHLEFLRRLRNDPRMNRHLFSPAVPISVGEQRLWYERQLGDPCSRVLIAHVGGVGPVGYGQLKNIDHVHRSVELGFHIAPEHQGKGYGSALVQALVRLATETLGMHRLYLEVMANNTRAIHVYEENGFAREGLLRDRVYKNGRYEDVVVMSIIHDDDGRSDASPSR
jgi:diamine N-acetyltransferase